MHKGLHPRADVDHLYLPRNYGGRNLKSVKDSIQLEEQSLAHYVWINSHQEPLITALQDSGIFPEPSTSQVRNPIIPIVIGTLASNLHSNLQQLPGKHTIQPLLKAALLGSAHILCKDLDLHEIGFFKI